MKQLLILFLLFNTMLFSIDVKFNYKINNDEFLYKKRIMEKELMNKEFSSIIGLKSYLIYNELTSSDVLIHFKLKDTNSNSHVQQFIVKQNNAGTPSIYEINNGEISGVDYTYKLDDFIKQTFMTGDAVEDEKMMNKYLLPTAKDFLPAIFNYDTVDKFLTYSYNYTLKFIIRNRKEVIDKRLNTHSFYLSMNSAGVPKISTNDTANSIVDEKIGNMDTLLFSFASGLNLSKRLDFKKEVLDNTVDSGSNFINHDKINYNKNLSINTSPGLISLIKPGDNFVFNFVSFTVDAITGEDVKVANNIEIEEFYIIKADIEFLK